MTGPQVDPGWEVAPAVGGLEETEAQARASAGQANVSAARASRTVADILRANLFTRFNAVLGAVLVAVLVVGPPQDAVFGLVLVANTAIGVLQELRAKRTLDRLSILTQARATVTRSGRVRSVPASGVVVGDLLQIGAGDQVIVDGEVMDAEGLEVNEALLTGESAPVPKPVGSSLLSGSYAGAGRAWYRAERVGEACYARSLVSEGRRFQLVRSELVAGINRILGLITWALIPLAVLQIAVQLRVHPALPDAVRASAAGIVTLIPEGLFLLTSVSLAVAMVRLGRRRILAQQLAAVEMLARVDVVCLDKTGTLTDGTVALERLVPLEPGEEAAQALGALARLDPRPDETLRAVADALPSPGWRAAGVVPFSSERRWAAAGFAGHGAWALGAPEALLSDAFTHDRARTEAQEMMRGGLRVLLLARAGRASAEDRIPPGVAPAALVVLRERLRPDAARTLAYLADRGVAVKVLSGDHPATVGAAARSLGLGGGQAVDGTSLERDDVAELRVLVESASVFGRVGPQQKQAVVKLLRSLGHTVAMVGDGVNDVPAMKAADIAIAMGRGSDAARAAAPLVLLDSSFAQVPAVVMEGRRVIGNIERLADLFVSKTVYAIPLILAASAAVLPFPFLPRHLTLVGAFTIGIPSVFLALAANRGRVRQGFVGRVARFAVPAGLAAGAAGFAGYAIALSDPAVCLPQARTAAVFVLALVALWILLRVARPLTAARLALVAAMAAGLALAFVLPGARSLLALDLLPLTVWIACLGVAVVAVAALEAALRLLRLDDAGAPPGRPSPAAARGGAPGPGVSGRSTLVPHLASGQVDGLEVTHMIANRPDSHRIGPAVKLLVGSGDKIAIFMMPLVVLGVLLNLLFPAVFSVGGPPTPLLVISIAALVPGLIIWAWSVALILTRVPRGELITSGPFALVRHPIYTGVALLVLPWVGFLCNTWLGAVIGIVLYVGTRIFAPEEEAALARTFGARWEEYRARVLIPWM